MTERRPAAQFAESKRKRAVFVAEYLRNNRDSAAAAIAAGFSAKTAKSVGSRLLKEEGISRQVAAAAARVAAKIEVTTVRTMREAAHVAYNDPRRFLNDDGTLKPASEWDDSMAACVASLEVSGAGVHKIKFWPKMDAIDKLMRHLGLFEKDNRQLQQSLAIQINLVGSDPAPAREVVVQANLVDGRRG